MKKAKTYLLIYLCSIFLLTSKECFANELIVSFGEHNAQPYAFIDKGELKGGIVKDVMEKLGEELNLSIQFKLTPRKRLNTYMQQGKVHMIVLSNPKWFKQSDAFQWSKPLFKERNLFVTHANSNIEIKVFEDLHGKVLGTNLGYFYPNLSEHFSSKQIAREDALTLEQNFKKLAVKRIDALINSDILIFHYLRKHNLQNMFSIAAKVASEHDLSSAL